MKTKFYMPNIQRRLIGIYSTLYLQLRSLGFVLIVLLFSPDLVAQQTGDFNLSIHFPAPLANNGNAHVLAFSVPTTYNSANSYKLIFGMHGVIDPTSSTNMRNYLSGLASNLNAILVCIDPYSNLSVSSLLINSCMDTTRKLYNIDTNNIYFLGSNLGGVPAMDYTFHNPHKIKGLILFSPEYWFAGYTPNYANSANYPPICSCVGANATSYVPYITNFHDSINSHGGQSQLNIWPGVGTSMNVSILTSEMTKCFSYINASVGINESVPQQFVNIYPNPSNGVFNIQLKEESDVFIYSSIGELVYHQKHNMGKVQVFLDGLTNGIYFVKIKNQHQEEFSKIVYSK